MTNTESDNSREWAAQAYALLKKRQEEQKQELQEQGFLASSSNENIAGPLKNTDEPELGEFDENFTWSAMVLAAQGRKFINGVLRRLQTVKFE